jgi:hypothetical protein
MFNSSAAINAMPCGHYMHQGCYNAFITRHYRCPICQKSVVNMELQWRKLDDAIASQPMPAKLRDTVVEVRCNDCHGKSLCRYHWLGNRCGLCDSYNTLHVKFIKQDEQQQDDATTEASGSSSHASPGQRSPNLVPQRAQRYFQDDEEVAAMAEALAEAQSAGQNGVQLPGSGALDSALALSGHAYRILADMSRNLEPFRQYLNQVHPSMLEEAERLGLVNRRAEGAGEGEGGVEAQGFWSEEEEEDGEDEEEEETSELGRDELDLDAEEEEEDEDDDEEEEEEESEWEDDDEEAEPSRLDIFLIGHM